MEQLTFAVLNPGHFHAALCLRDPHPNLADDVYVYAPDGEELETFCNYIRDFNAREQSPTNWNLHVYKGEDSLEVLFREKKADIVILAGKNDTKIRNIEKLNRAGFKIFSDKPWLTDENGLRFLRDALQTERPLTMDIMTERFEITTLLQKMFLAEPEVFGKLRIDPDGSPTIYKESVHHLLKQVNGKPLKRPAWYFDVNTQGEGIVDVTTHLVDMTHWMLFPGEKIHYEKDIQLREARRWVTLITQEKFSAITRHNDFPESVRGQVRNNVLPLYCNGEISYTVKSIPVHIKVLWNVEPPPGAGDTHFSRIKGTFADLVVRQLPERNYLSEFLITPHANPDAFAAPIQAVLDKHAAAFPGLSLKREGNDYLIEIPAARRTTHEQHFGEARSAFLDMLENGNEPPEMRANIVAKYSLLVEARKCALASPFEPLKQIKTPN